MSFLQKHFKRRSFSKVTKVSESCLHTDTLLQTNMPALCAAQHHFFPTPSPTSREGMPTRPHPRAERRLKPDEWSLGTACSPGPYFTPQSLIKTRCGASQAKAAYSSTERRTLACSDIMSREETGRRSQLKSLQLAHASPSGSS